MFAKLTRDLMHQTIECYCAKGNGAYMAKIMTCFTAEAVHYFPPGTNISSWRGQT